MTTVWDEWGRLTRFFKSARIAFRREDELWASLELGDSEAARVRAMSGLSSYEVTLQEHRAAVTDQEVLSAMVLVHSYALAEGAASERLGLEVSSTAGIEDWGTRILEANDQGWHKVVGERAGAVEVAVTRNAIAHGTWALSQKGFNRLANVGGESGWQVGQRITLEPEKLEDYRARLKSLLRIAAIGQEARR